MKKSNITGINWKIQFLGGGGGGGVTKSQYTWGDYQEGGLGQFADLRGGLAKKRGRWCFWDGWYRTANHEIENIDQTARFCIIMSEMDSR